MHTIKHFMQYKLLFLLAVMSHHVACDKCHLRTHLEPYVLPIETHVVAWLAATVCP